MDVQTLDGRLQKLPFLFEWDTKKRRKKDL